MDDKELIKAILHYQQCLEKYTRRNDEARVLYCLSKLYKMPVGIGHLQETGVGRTVNALRKHHGEIGEAAKALVGKWKEMVTADGEDNDTKETSKSESTKHNDKHKTHGEKSGSSHIESNKKKSRSNSVSEDDSKHSSKRAKEETKHRHHDSKDTRAKKDKYKSSKKIRDSSDESDEEENDYDANNEKSSDRSRSTSEERNVKPEKKSKHSKNENDENREYTKSKRKKYSENDESDEEVELSEKKKKSNKHHHEKKEKSKHEHKKDKRESETKSKKDDTKSKEKQSSTSTSKSNSKSDKKDKQKDSKSDKKSKQSSSKNSDETKKSKKSSQRGTMAENGIGSGSGASFAEALGMLMPSSSKTSKKKVAIIHPLTVDKPSTQSRDSSPDVDPSKIPELLSPKKLTPLDIKLDNLLPEITPNYRPLGFPIDAQMFKNKLSSEDETLSAIMYNKISRTKVYSGNKVAWGKVPSLFEICTRVLQDNIDALEYTGGVPYLILKPVIERANPDQLFMLEHHNPYLIEDTDELWQLHCNKEFRNKRREEMETWRDMYMRCLDEREAKLRALTANIKQSQDKSLPVRQTKLAYIDSFVKPPRNIARKQAKHGTGGGVDKKPTVTPSSRLNALATSGAAGQVSVPNPGTRAVSSSGSSTAVVKLKKAPLMQKTLALMKNRMFKR